MTLKKFTEFQSLEEVKSFHEDVKSNLSMDDVKAGDIKTEVPTTDTLDKGQHRFVEVGGEPRHYYRSLSGTIYLMATGTAI